MALLPTKTACYEGLCQLPGWLGFGVVHASLGPICPSANCGQATLLRIFAGVRHGSRVSQLITHPAAARHICNEVLSSPRLLLGLHSVSRYVLERAADISLWSAMASSALGRLSLEYPLYVL